ncbi:MAG TPA: phenylalanine--tRNA ligase subunit beta [Patescibacteria group bacterium]|jgi:phenylalanyl-tRNA synthetase beta chain
MQVSVDWLKDYAPMKAGAHGVAERLTMTLNEVDEIRAVDHLKEVVVGEIAEIAPHPNAELRVAKVATGDTKRRTVVVRDQTLQVGQKVPVVLPGTVLPSGLRVERRDIRGVTSDGMMCSARELDAGEDDSGVWVLPADAKVSARLPAALGRRHDTFDLEVLANRPDCMGHLGIAREAAAAFGVPFTEPKLKTPDRKKPGPYGTKLPVAGCDRYALAYLGGVANKQSPAWLKRRLTTVGLRPINAIVDVTNFVMLEYGQPLHAMDAERITGRDIRVREARSGEPVVTLDGEERKAPKGSLLIADSEKALGFAGIMGGRNCEVGDGTTEVLLECANFDAARIRRTSRALGLRTDASARFEKGISAEYVGPAVRRAIDLIREICGGQLVQLADVRKRAAKPSRIVLEPARADAFLGMAIPPGDKKRILARLGFGVSGSGAKWTVTVPYWRTDVRLPEDLYEELTRQYGYEKVPETLPGGSSASTKPAELVLADRLRDLLVAAGLTEVLTHSLVGPKLLERSGFPHKLPEIANPLSEDFRYLRGSMGPRHLEAVQANLRWRDRIGFFEVGRVFEAAPAGQAPHEQRKLLATIGTKRKADTFEAVRGIWTLVSERLGVPEDRIQYKAVEMGKFMPGRHFQIKVGKAKVGWVADFRYPDRFKADSISMLSLNLDRLQTVLPGRRAVAMPPTHPAVRRDLSVYLPERSSYAELERIVRQNGKPHLRSIGTPELFRHQGRRSIMMPLEFRTDGRTLTDAEVNRLMANVETAIKSHGWEVR